MTPDERGVLWLGLGAACGLALALYGLVRPDGVGIELQDGAETVATVNGTPLGRDAFDRQLAAWAAERGAAAGEAERRRVLERMIDEELLVQRALELGLARHDRRVRSDLVAAMLDSINAQSDAEIPEPSVLREFHAENRRYFEHPPRFRVQELFVSASSEEGGAARAASLRARLDSGATFEELRAAADLPVAPLPATALPAAKLRQHLGRSGFEAVEALPVGGVAGPIESGGGWRVLRLVERTQPERPDFDAILPQVRTEWRRRAAERTLRDYLARLRSRASIELPLD